MTSAFEFSVEEFFHDLAGSFSIDVATWHNQNIGVVVQACHFSNFRNPNQSGTDTLMLVECHTDAFTATTNSNARITFTSFYCYSQLVCKVRVVTTFCAVSTKVLIFPTLGFQPSFDIFFQFVTCVVTC